MIGSRLTSHRPIPAPITVTEITRHRLIRQGAVPVLEVTVCYPRLECEGDGGRGVTAFNQAYEAMAEAFLLWADRVLGTEASEAYAAMGISAAYRFDRRLLVCSMRAEFLPAPDFALAVRRAVTYSSRRGTVAPHSRNGEEIWRLPSLTLCGGRRGRKLGANY
jgi:hypothetical protein